jgi:pyrroline-5-carboxylate reductase
MNIVIVGAGNVGRALGGGWLKTGHKVTMAVREPASSRIWCIGPFKLAKKELNFKKDLNL